MLAAGYAVAGKDPAASFLTNIRDSPAVRRGSSSGQYRIDPQALARTRQAHAEALAELEDLENRIAGITRDALAEPPRPGELEELREHRQALKAQLRRLELEADEVAAIVATETRESLIKPRLVA